MSVQWKNIIINNKNTNYEVSELGEVRNIKTGKFLKGTFLRNEYHTVQLTVEGEAYTKMVHRLVAEAFIPNPNNYNIVDHIDRNKHNNKVENLRWVDTKTNSQNRKKKKKDSSIEVFEGDINQLKPLLIDSNYLATKNGKIVNAKTKRILKGSIRNGYNRVFIKAKHYSAHRLIWEAYNGKIPENLIIDHIDGNKSNNALDNLRLVSQSENVYHNIELGKGTAKKVYQYSLNGDFIKEYSSLTEAEQNVDVTKEAIGGAIKRGGSSGGFLWTFKDSQVSIEELVEKNKKPRSDAKGVTQYNIKGNKIQYFYSIAQAAASVSCSPSTITRGANAKRLAKGYYWILDNSDITINDLI